MTDAVNPLGRFDLPFAEQIDFFRRKTNLGTQAWTDIWEAQHDRSFVVAGAMKADLLNEIRQAVDKAIATGTTLETFRKEFRDITDRLGWPGTAGAGSKGGFNWRTKVIYETNLRTSYAAGREAQLADPGLQKLLPFRRYVHNDSVLNPRPQHLAWNGLTLPHDHPFWQTHSPPNGWGCRCRVTAVAAPKKGDATKPPAGWDDMDPETGAPPGIDKGWGYAPGASVLDELRALVDAKVAKLPEPLGKALAADVERNLSSGVIDYLGRGKFDELSQEMKLLGQGDENLTEAENVGLFAYTKSWYLQVNRKLRTGNVGAGSTDPDPLISMVDRALEKLPTYSGAVTRGVHYPYEVFNDLSAKRAGDVISFRSYSSAAHSGQPDFGGNTRFVIEARSARKIDHIAYEKRESEAIIPRSTQFEITNIEIRDNGGRMTVHLRELDANEYQDAPTYY